MDFNGALKSLGATEGSEYHTAALLHDGTEFAKVVDDKFSFFAREMFCANPEHPGIDLRSAGSFTRLVTWVGEHWDCVKPLDTEYGEETSMSKDADKVPGKPEPYHGKHRAEDVGRHGTRSEGFRVDSKERDERGVGNEQTGGRDD